MLGAIAEREWMHGKELMSGLPCPMCNGWQVGLHPSNSLPSNYAGIILGIIGTACMESGIMLE